MSRMKEEGMDVPRNEHISKDQEVNGKLGSSVNRN